MIIIYTRIEGGEWIPFNTPYAESEIRSMLEDDSAECLLSNYRLPARFHSILLPSGYRWYVTTMKWSRYTFDDMFAEFLAQYFDNCAKHLISEIGKDMRA